MSSFALGPAYCVWPGPVRCVVPTLETTTHDKIVIVSKIFLGFWDRIVNFCTTTVQTNKKVMAAISELHHMSYSNNSCLVSGATSTNMGLK